MSCKRSRTIITQLVFTDKGALSRQLISHWNSKNCSTVLKKYLKSLLLAVLRAKPAEFMRWGVEMILHLLQYNDRESVYLLQVLEEAIADSYILAATIRQLEKLNFNPILLSESVKIRLLANEEGIEYLESRKLVTPMVQAWLDKDCAAFSAKYEKALNYTLGKYTNRTSKQKSSSSSSLSAAATAASTFALEGHLNIDKIPIDVYNFEASPTNASIRSGQDVDLEGLLR